MLFRSTNGQRQLRLIAERIEMSQQRLPRNQDLLFGSLLVVFFVLFGMVICFNVIQPVLIDERVFTLFGGIFLGFAMTFGALRITRFRTNDGDDEQLR